MDYKLEPPSGPRTDFHAILRSKFVELDRATIDEMTWDEARNYYWANRPKQKPKDTRETVCFTGFTAGEKEPLLSLAEEMNLRVVGSVVKKLNYLVFGLTAGPKKLEKATGQGVSIISEKDFRDMGRAID